MGVDRAQANAAVTEGSTGGPAAPVAGRPRRIAELPSPPALPIVGHARHLRSSTMHQQLERWRERYGDAYRVHVGGRHFVVLSDPDVIADVLRDRPDGFQRSQRLMDAAAAMGFDGVFSAGGDRWRRQRPMVMAGFDPSHIRGYFPTLVTVTQRLAGRWRAAADGGRRIDLQADLMRYTIDVTAGLAFGSDTNTIESDGDILQHHLNQILPTLFRRLMTPLPFRHLVRLPSDREVERHIAAVKAATNDFIAQARARLAADAGLREKPRNLIEAMIVARDAPGSGVDDRDIVGNVLTMLLAGEDTTANTLAWTLWLLHANPMALQRARAEVRGVLVARRLASDPADLARLPFAEACAVEAMRLRPVAPLIVQQALRDTVVGGIEVPRGTHLMLLMRPSGVDERRFERPQAYEPQRWLAEGESAVRSLSTAKRVSMPFGAGPRLCPGRYLAMHEMKMVLAMLLAGFEIESVEADGGGEPRERLAFAMSPVGLRMVLRERG